MEPTVSGETLLEVRDLSVSFAHGKAARPAVDRLSYSLRATETLAIVGQSGSGKTVSCRALMGLLPQSARVSGSMRFLGQELLNLGERQMRSVRGAGIAMIFQDPARSLNPTMRVGDQIVEVLRQHRRLTGAEARTEAVNLLHKVRFSHPDELLFAWPHQLSGGMQQRIMIVMALASRPRVLIADEATKSLDVITQAGVLRLLKDLQSESGMALVLITHDLRIAAGTSSYVLVMHEGRLVEQGHPSDVLSRPKHDYTRALLDAVLPGPVIVGRTDTAARTGLFG